MDMSWTVTAVLIAIVVYLLYRLATINTRYWEKRGVASIYTPPILGILFNTVLMRKGQGQIVTEFYNKLEGERFGGYFQLLTPVLMVRDPEIINRILIKDFVHFENRGPNWKQADDLFSLGISNLIGDEWRTARHKLTPTFTSGKLKMMFEHINNGADDVIAYLKTNLDEDINAKEVSLKYVINVVASVAFGLKINTLTDSKDNEFYNISSRFFAPSLKLLLKVVFLMSIPKLRKFIDYKIMEPETDHFFRKLAKDMIKLRESTGQRRNDFMQIMLDQRERERKLLVNDNLGKPQDEEIYDPDDKELLEHLKNTPTSSDAWNKSTEIFTDDFIAAQTFLFISGGSETTATTLSFILYELAVNQDCQKRAQKEIEDVLSNNDFNYQAIKKMTYMDQIINESMRLHPITSVLMRSCTKNYTIPGTEVAIDKGTFVIVPMVALHMDPQYFADPKKFDPSRFEDMNSIPKGVYFNFGDGPRICIAMRLAILEMKILLAKLLLNFDIVLSKKTKLPLKPLKSAFLLTIEGGLWVKFLERKK